MVPKTVPGYVQLSGSGVAASCFWGGRDCNCLQGEGTGGVASPTRLALRTHERDGRHQRGRAREGLSAPKSVAPVCCSPTVGLVVRHSLPSSSMAALERHEASSTGRSQPAAGHWRWEGNHKDERKRSSQGGAKLWPGKAAPMAGPYQTHWALSEDVLGAPGAPGRGLTCRSILRSPLPLESADGTFPSLSPSLLLVLSPLV